MIFYVHALLLFTKYKTYIFENIFRKPILGVLLEKEVKMQDYSFVAQGSYDVVYGLDLNLCSDVMYVYNGPCHV